MDSPGQTYRPLLEAVSFAARAHRHQLRKDGQTPYAAHPFRVCLVLRHVFGVSDLAALTAAALHDTVEDTTTDYDDLAKHFGDEVAGWVALLSKDKRQPEEAREEAYLEGLAAAPWQVKACKLADLFDNLMDSSHFGPEQQARTIKKAKDALKVLDAPDLPGPVRQAWETVSRLVKEMEPRKRGQGKA